MKTSVSVAECEAMQEAYDTVLKHITDMQTYFQYNADPITCECCVVLLNALQEQIMCDKKETELLENDVLDEMEIEYGKGD